MSENKVALIYQILFILKKHSSEERPLKISDIQKLFLTETHSLKAPTPKTIRRHVEELIELSQLKLIEGTIAEEPLGNAFTYYFTPLISREETHLLCEAVASSRFIDKDLSWQLISKLGAPFPREFTAKYKPAVALKRNDRKMYNTEFFDTIRVLTAAIEKKRKVRFQYLQYDVKKRLVPRIKENGGYSTVSPFHLVWTLDHYYLYCKIDPAGKERFLRVDKIRDASLLEHEKTAPYEAAKWNTSP
jgi:hypothetical protein